MALIGFLKAAIANFLFQVNAQDPWTYLAVIGLLGFIAMVACFVPARRATQVDPMVALRID
jgi:putative ABC transport system permease protein